MSGTHSRGLSQERASTATYSKMFILYICKSTPDIYPKLINNEHHLLAQHLETGREQCKLQYTVQTLSLENWPMAD